jgi:hypothetical protein
MILCLSLIFESNVLKFKLPEILFAIEANLYINQLIDIVPSLLFYLFSSKVHTPIRTRLSVYISYVELYISN